MLGVQCNDLELKYYHQAEAQITLQEQTTTNIKIQTGFFPKVINDFNVFYKGYDLYVNYVSVNQASKFEIICQYNASIMSSFGL